MLIHYSSDLSIDNVYEKIKNIGFPLKSSSISLDIYKDLLNFEREFSHKEFNVRVLNPSKDIMYIPKINFPTKFSLPFLDSDGKLSFRDPEYYLFISEKEDYQRYNILTDRYTESSRVKSFRPTKNNNKYSPYKLWNSSNKISVEYKKRAINYILKNKQDITQESLRESLYNDPFIKETSNEKVTFIISLWKLLNYKNKKLKIFDACAGWGDRLLASIVCRVEKYIGVDPNSNSREGFETMIDELADGNDNYKVFIDAMPNAKIEQDLFDICYLSPPAYDSEFYSKDEKQSVSTFTNREEWERLFLFKTIDRCYSLLDKGGILVVHSLLSVEINNYIRGSFYDMQYLGMIGFGADSGNNKKIWLWIKADKNNNLQRIISSNKAASLFKFDIKFKPAFLTDKETDPNFSMFNWKTSTRRDWSRYSHVIIKKIRNYQDDIDRFKEVLKNAEEKLITPLKTILWNMKNDYIINLPFSVNTVKEYRGEFDNERKVIVKPLVGNEFTVISPRNIHKKNPYKYFITQLLISYEYKINIFFLQGEYYGFSCSDKNITPPRKLIGISYKIMKRITSYNCKLVFVYDEGKFYLISLDLINNYNIDYSGKI